MARTGRRDPGGGGRLWEGVEHRCPNRRCSKARKASKISAVILKVAHPTGFEPVTFAFGASTTGSTPECAVACRSDEHTSELQSLMRISYAVFCLKKKRHQYRT